MGCEQYEPHLTAYLDNELTDEARSMIERHLEGCSACRETLADLRAAGSVMQQWKDAPVGEDFLLRMREKLRREKRSARRSESEPASEVRMPRRSRTTVSVGEPETTSSRWKWVRLALAASVLVGAVGAVTLTEMGRAVTGERPLTQTAAREMVKSAQSSTGLNEVAVATDYFVAAQVRQENPRVAGVIGAETVQMFLETASAPEEKHYVEILMGSEGKSVLAAAPWRQRTSEALALEMRQWANSGLCASSFAQDVPGGSDEMTARTESSLAEGLRLERLGKYEEAIDAYAAVHGGKHERTVALVRRAGLLIRLGRFKEAQESLTEAENGRFEDELMGTIVERLSKRVEIAQQTSPRIDELKRSLALKPQDTKGWRELADLELGWGNYVGAAQALTGLAGQLKGDARDMARFRAAWCSKNAGDYVNAFAEVEKLRAQEGSSEQLRELCLFESGDILYRCGRFAQSIEMHRTLIGYPGAMDDSSRALLILRVGFIQLYDLTDKSAAKDTLRNLTEARYARTPAGLVAQEMLAGL